MSASLPQFISLSTLAGMFASLLLAWFVMYRGLARLETSKEKRVIATLITGGVLLAWFFIALLLALQGFFEVTPSDTFQFPNIAFTFLPLLLGLTLLAFSKRFRRLVDALPLHLLMGIQLYRVLGILFLILLLQGLLPAEFAIPAGIGDIAVGITAPLVAYLYVARKKYARQATIVWNIFGIGDLVLAFSLGFMTSPGTFQLLAFDAPNTLVSAYPLVMIPAFGMPLSILLHVFALRKLRQ